MKKCKYCGLDIVTARGQIRTKHIDYHKQCLRKLKKRK